VEAIQGFKSTLRLFKPEVLQRISFDEGLDALAKQRDTKKIAHSINFQVTP